MEDSKIINLFWERSETAIFEISKKYSKYCLCISYSILHSNEDAEECVNDTYMNAWNAIPPTRPIQLSTYLGKITRNLSLQRYKKYTAAKRGYGQVALALSELEDCIPACTDADQFSNQRILVRALNNFLFSLSKQTRVVFVLRYWYLLPIEEIAQKYNMSVSKVKSMLFRTRNKLRIYLEREGIVI